MSRLLFAAARGARVQCEQMAITGKHTWWEDTPVQWGMDDELRIHPDDEHLQYGPISTALREIAIYADRSSTLVANGTYGIWTTYISTYLEYKECSDELHRSLFLLILAEALADEGL